MHGYVLIQSRQSDFNNIKKEHIMKKQILVCTCSFACPGMKWIDFSEIIERIQPEAEREFMLYHLRLCRH